jgi:hypothetical protein
VAPLRRRPWVRGVHPDSSLVRVRDTNLIALACEV